MDVDDFEAMVEEDEVWLRDSPPRVAETVSNNKRKVPTIDDLLKDHQKEKNKSLDREFKRARRLAVSDSNSSEDEEFEEKTHTEQQVEELLESCQRQVHAFAAPVEVTKWGEKIFGSQRRDAVEPKLEGSVVQLLSAARGRIVQSFRASEDIEATPETIMSELLVSGFLVPLGVSFRKLGEATLRWIFHKMVYSVDKRIEKSACEFWCRLLQANSESSGHHWMPSFEFILTIFQNYGYLGSVFSNNQRPGAVEILEAEGPPHNLGSLLRFLTVSFKTECLHQDLSPAEAGKLMVLVATLSLDRRLLCYGALIQECLESIANHFTEDSWATFCEKIAISMTEMDMDVVNCLRLTRSLHSSGGPMKSLQTSVALRFFSKKSDSKALSGRVWDVLSVFRKVNLRKNEVDFVSLYYQMTLADIWLWSNPDLMSDQQLESWFLFLKSCSYQISSTDWRTYAAKVRNWASYLLTIYQGYRKTDDFEETSGL